MKKLLSALLLTLVGASVQAQNQPLACLTEESAGLKWESGRWVTKSFNPIVSKFILVQVRNTLTIDSASKALIASPSSVSCRNDVGYKLRIECTDTTGGSLYFDPTTLKGGISQLLGSTSSSVEKDTVSVLVFSCTPF